MAGHSIPIDFRVDPIHITDPGNHRSLLKKLCALIEPYSGPLSEVAILPLQGGHYQAVYSVPNGNSLSVKMYTCGLVSGMFEHYTEDINRQLIAIDDAMLLEDNIVEACDASVAKVLPAIKRCPPINPYYTSSDDRLLEYDIDSVVFQEKTLHQKVEILHSKSFGNILVLDNLQNLGDSDIAYTHALMNKGDDSYTDKTVLILGGGDGALMHELLKENPKHVIMIDIDEAVMRSCKEHLRLACGSTLDSFSGDNYEIIVGDALVYLKEFVASGREFDYVFSDLTDIPISPEPLGDAWEFLGLVMELGTKVLKPGTGRYMTHAIGTQCTSALAMFSTKLAGVEVGISEITLTSRFVPSFMEKWCFFQATRSPLEVTSAA